MNGARIGHSWSEVIPPIDGGLPPNGPGPCARRSPHRTHLHLGLSALRWRIPERGLVVKWSFSWFSLGSSVGSVRRFSARGVPVPLSIDAPNPRAFLELRPSGDREEAPVLLLCAFQVRKSRMNLSLGWCVPLTGTAGGCVCERRNVHCVRIDYGSFSGSFATFFCSSDCTPKHPFVDPAPACEESPDWLSARNYSLYDRPARHGPSQSHQRHRALAKPNAEIQCAHSD